MGIHMLTPLYEQVVKRVLKTEEQTQHDSIIGLDVTDKIRAGQKLTISNRKVAKLAFKLVKIGNPTGDVTFTIRGLVSGLISSKVWGDASAIPTTYPATTWQEVTFGSPQTINEDARVCAEFSGGDGSNLVAVSIFTASDIKPSEYLVHYRTSWVALPDDDCAYRYKYY